MENIEEFKAELERTKWECIPDEFVVFDLETTGLTPNEDRIVEIGAILFRKTRYLESGEVENFQCLIKQSSPIPLESIRIHGITDDMVKDGDSEYAALTQFFEFVGNRKLYAYNAKFDKDFLKATAKRCGYYDKQFRLEVEDVMSIVSDAFDDLPNRKLQTVAKHIDYNGGQTHRALDDCATTLHVLVYCMQKIMIKQSVELRAEYLALKEETEKLRSELAGASANGSSEQSSEPSTMIWLLAAAIGMLAFGSFILAMSS